MKQTALIDYNISVMKIWSEGCKKKYHEESFQSDKDIVWSSHKSDIYPYTGCVYILQCKAVYI